jgi:gamma-glutamyltranspeptidase/glutathione hydrolase
VLDVLAPGVNACPAPNSQAATALHALKILDGYEIGDGLMPDADRIHVSVEAAKLGLGLRNRMIADPRYRPFRSEEFLGKRAIRASRERISLDRAAEAPVTGWRPGDTAHFVVADNAGNVVSAIQSLYLAFIRVDA